MIVVLEGPDGSGKTTLARALIHAMNMGYLHEGPPPPQVDLLAYYGAKLDAARGEDIVFDRLAFGERIYGPAVRNIDRLGHTGWQVFKRLMTAVNAKHVLCLPSYEVAHANWSSRRLGAELIEKEPTFKRVYDDYKRHIKEFDFVYNYTNPDELSRLINYLYDSPQTLLTRPMIGSPTARYLFIGDRGRNRDSPTTDLPFFGVKHSSAYLYDAIKLAGFKESEIAFINVYSWLEGKRITLPREFAVNIALGREAGRHCIREGLKHTELPHPQFWRRFHFHDIKGYAELMRQCRS